MADEFRTTLMGGFDKDDVLNKVQIIREEANAEKSRLIKLGKDKDEKIEELYKNLEEKDVEKENALEELRQEHKKEMEEMQKALQYKEEQKNRLERQIQDKYQKYIDRYDLIGSLIFDAQEKAEKMLEEAEEVSKNKLREAERKSEELVAQAEKTSEQLVAQAEEKSNTLIDGAKKQSERIVHEAIAEGERHLNKVQMEIGERLSEGKQKYLAVQEEMNEIVDLINRTQRSFMTSYKEVHRIISTMPEFMCDMEEEHLEIMKLKTEEMEVLGECVENEPEEKTAEVEISEVTEKVEIADETVSADGNMNLDESDAEGDDLQISRILEMDNVE